ncbi:MAG: protein kinase [Planctomycetales bacterium]|nr:protein kinase [Planctomycetales bacterium]
MKTLTMEAPGLCTVCGTRLGDSVLDGCCPACLMLLAVDAGAAEKSSANQFQPPLPVDLAGLFADLEIQELIGVGGMGAVYTARQVRLDRRVALKLLPSERARDPEFAERFQREGQAQARLSHPHIVGVYDAGQAGDYLYIVMEYVEGSSLRELLRDHRVGPVDAMRWVPQICDAMQFAHDRGVIHRDIKPENILITSQGMVKIADFGLAKLNLESDSSSFSLTSTDVRMGTPRYMAPEQIAQTSAVDHRADIYSLGVMFYEMLTGELPTVDYKPPSCNTEVDPRVDRVVARSIKSSPDERYQKAGDIKQDVEWISANPTKWLMRVGAWGVAAVVLVVFVMGIVSHFRENPKVPTSGNRGNVTISVQSDSSSPSNPEVVRVTPHPLLSDDYEWSAPVNLGPGVNTVGSDECATVSGDGLTMIFCRSEGSGLQLWDCRRANLGEPFGSAVRLSGEINREGYVNDCPFLSRDGLTLWFASTRPSGHGLRDLWMSRRKSTGDAWGEPSNLGANVNTAGFEQSPFVTDDGLTLLFSRAVSGQFQILQATRRNENDPFAESRILSNVNCGVCSSFPRLTADKLNMVFVHCPAKGEPLRLFLAARTSDRADFGQPIDLGPIINDSVVSGPALSADGLTLFYSSQRDGGIGGVFDLWSATRRPKQKP